jgi:hypothetical protein
VSAGETTLAEPRIATRVWIWRFFPGPTNEGGKSRISPGPPPVVPIEATRQLASGSERRSTIEGGEVGRGRSGSRGEGAGGGSWPLAWTGGGGAGRGSRRRRVLTTPAATAPRPGIRVLGPVRGDAVLPAWRAQITGSDEAARIAKSATNQRGLSAIQSPRKPNGLSHCIFECLIVEASSQAQNHLSVLADRYTEWCRGVFDCTGDR